MAFALLRSRGVILTAIGAQLILGEHLTVLQNIMLGLMVPGLCLVAFSLRPKGVRLSGSVMADTLILYLGDGVGVGLIAVLRHPERLVHLPLGVLPVSCRR